MDFCLFKYSFNSPLSISKLITQIIIVFVIPPVYNARFTPKCLITSWPIQRQLACLLWYHNGWYHGNLAIEENMDAKRAVQLKSVQYSTNWKILLAIPLGPFHFIVGRTLHTSQILHPSQISWSAEAPNSMCPSIKSEEVHFEFWINVDSIII